MRPNAASSLEESIGVDIGCEREGGMEEREMEEGWRMTG